MIERKTLARQLLEASKLLDVLDEDPFRSRAYANAARALEAFEGDLEELAARGRLTDIEGIGAGLAEALGAEPVDGVLPILAQLRERVPVGVRELFRVSGLGASKVRALWGAGFDSLEALIEGVESGSVQALKGFGAKSAASFAAGARFALRAKTRMRRDEAEAILAELGAVLEEVASGAELHALGAFRRGMEVVDDLDLVATGVSAARLEAFARSVLEDGAPERTEPEGPPAFAGQLAGRPVRIVLAPADAAGATIAVRTGSEPYVAWLRDRAVEHGFRLEEHGLFRGAERVPTPTEADVFDRLGLPAPAPELREEPGAPAVEGLIEPRDVRGLVHNHSTWSDAEHSIREMVAAARSAGYAYLAMADHSVSNYIAGGLTEERVRRQADEIRAIRTELADEGADFSLLHGIEVDIRADGSLDYADDVLELLDYTVVSIHQQFTLGRAAQTARIVAAVQSPYADILGHATGRLLLRRPEYDVDLDAVIDACAASGTVIEINANPRRLDLDWRWVRVAKARGCRFSIDPDAHHIDGYDDVRYGVTVARKAALTPADVVNTAPTAAEFLARLKRVRRGS